MGEIRHSIDWLQYTLAWPDSVQEWPIDNDEELAIFRTCVPMLQVEGLPPFRKEKNKALGMGGFTKTYNMLWCTAHVDPKRRHQKIGVRFTGANMEAYRNLGGTDLRLIEFIKHNNGKPTRIDIAFDMFNFGIDPLVVYRDWMAGKVKTRARTVKPFTKSVRAGDGTITSASTLYIGSRTSPVMVRIYEKGKETGTGLDWQRIELEIKDDKAAAVMNDIVRFGIEKVGTTLLAEAMPTMPYKFWRELMKGGSVALEAVGRKKTARQVWIENVILPMLQDELNAEWEADEPTGVTQALEACIRTNWQRRAIELRRQFGLVG